MLMQSGCEAGLKQGRGNASVKKSKAKKAKKTNEPEPKQEELSLF